MSSLCAPAASWRILDIILQPEKYNCHIERNPHLTVSGLPSLSSSSFSVPAHFDFPRLGSSTLPPIPLQWGNPIFNLGEIQISPFSRTSFPNFFVSRMTFFSALSALSQATASCLQIIISDTAGLGWRTSLTLPYPPLTWRVVAVECPFFGTCSTFC